MLFSFDFCIHSHFWFIASTLLLHLCHYLPISLSQAIVNLYITKGFCQTGLNNKKKEKKEKHNIDNWHTSGIIIYTVVVLLCYFYFYLIFCGLVILRLTLFGFFWQIQNPMQSIQTAKRKKSAYVLFIIFVCFFFSTTKILP